MNFLSSSTKKPKVTIKTKEPFFLKTLASIRGSNYSPFSMSSSDLTKASYFNSKYKNDHLETLKTIPDYQSEVGSIMSDYTYKSTTTHKSLENFEKTLTRTKKSFYNTKKNELSKIITQSKSHLRCWSWGREDLDEYKPVVSTKDPDFKGPMESLGYITRNKFIHDKLLNNYQEREITSFKKSLQIAEFIRNEKKTAGIVKISNVIPKIAKHAAFSPDDELDKIDTYKKKKKNIRIPPICYINKALPLAARVIYPPKQFPESREQFCWTEDIKTNNFYLYGGFSSNAKVNSIWELNTSTYSWNNITPEGIQPEPRAGHTGVIYKGKFIIYGGKYINIPVFCDIDIFNMETKTWMAPNIIGVASAKFRIHHISCLVGQHMVIFGGINESGQYLNDIVLLSLNPYKFINPSIKFGSECPPLAMHSAALVIPTEVRFNPKFGVYRFGDAQINKKFPRIREKGIYIFGGKSKEDGEPNNLIRVLRIGRKPLEWITIDAKGQPPCPRYLATMNYFEESNYLIIHGGRNDKLESGFGLNDTFILELYRFEWLRVKFDDSVKVMKRCSHESAVCGKNLIIFGGLNEDVYLGSSLFLINLDPEYTFKHTDYNSFNPNDSDSLSKSNSDIFDKSFLLQNTKSAKKKSGPGQKFNSNGTLPKIASQRK